MTAFVLCLPLLVAVLLSSVDLWTLVAAQTRVRAIAQAGVGYLCAQANADAEFAGTDAEQALGPLRTNAQEVAAVALRAGAHGAEGLVEGVRLDVQARPAGTARYEVVTYAYDQEQEQRRVRMVPLTEVKVSAEQDVAVSSWVLAQVLGPRTTVRACARGQLTREVVL